MEKAVMVYGKMDICKNNNLSVFIMWISSEPSLLKEYYILNVDCLNVENFIAVHSLR
jgi:hypothetical protein